MKKLNLSEKIKYYYNLKSTKTKKYKKLYNKYYKEIKKFAKPTTSSYNYYAKKIFKTLDKKFKSNRRNQIKQLEKYKLSEKKMYEKLYDERRKNFENYDSGDYEYVGVGFMNYIELYSGITDLEQIQTALSGMSEEDIGRLVVKANKAKKFSLQEFYYKEDDEYSQDDNLINVLNTIKSHLSEQRQKLLDTAIKTIGERSINIL